MGILKKQTPFAPEVLSMTAHKRITVDADHSEQLTLNIPGFDFTAPETDISAKPSTRAQASDRPAAAGQLRLQLDN